MNTHDLSKKQLEELIQDPRFNQLIYSYYKKTISYRDKYILNLLRVQHYEIEEYVSGQLFYLKDCTLQKYRFLGYIILIVIIYYSIRSIFIGLTST